MKEDLKRILNILTTGTPEEFHTAKKEIDHLFNTDHNLFHKNSHLLFDYLDKFDQIKNVKNQEAFCSGISLFFLTLGDENFEKLSEFTLSVIQSPDGHVREAIRKTSNWLNSSLSARMHPFYFAKKDTHKIKEDQKSARKEFEEYIGKIESLLDKYPYKGKSAKYIHKMEPSINKSLQMLWADVSYLYRFAVDSNSEIKRMRKDIKSKINRLISTYNLDTTLHEVEMIIFDEEGMDSMGKLTKVFAIKTNKLEDLSKIMEILNDAWNCFPHRNLQGLSPKEKYLESLN